MAVNPEAVAWYLQRSEALLDDHRGRIDALRHRAGQLAGFSGAILTLAGADAEAILSVLHGAARVCAGVSLLVGSAFLIAASVTALRWTLVPRLIPARPIEETGNYDTDRFIDEPDLWRVQLRTIRGVAASIRTMTRVGDQVAQAIETAQRYFFGGLSLIGAALGTLVIVVTF
jgi:hypothetical protein